MSFTLKFHSSSLHPESTRDPVPSANESGGRKHIDAAAPTDIAETLKTPRTAVVPPLGGNHDRSHQEEPIESTRPYADSSLLHGGSRANASAVAPPPSAALKVATSALPPTRVSDCAALYGFSHHCRPDQFAGLVFWKVLFPHAYFVGLPILLLWPGFFAADRAFLGRVGLVATIDQYDAVERSFQRENSRQSFLRGPLRLRVSSRRMRRLVVRLFAQAR